MNVKISKNSVCVRVQAKFWRSKFKVRKMNAVRERQLLLAFIAQAWKLKCVFNIFSVIFRLTRRRPDGRGRHQAAVGDVGDVGGEDGQEGALGDSGVGVLQKGFFLVTRTQPISFILYCRKVPGIVDAAGFIIPSTQIIICHLAI